MENKDFDFSDGAMGSNDQGFEMGGTPAPFEQANTNPSSSGVLTVEEENDPNAITVNIPDPSPIVIMFGARASGKTMTLVRLTRWLLSQGYQVEPELNFRPSNSEVYRRMCEDFHKTVNSDIAAASTSVMNFMLLKVMDKIGNPICQILEAPGEHYFDEDYPAREFPTYIQSISNRRNRRTWMFIVEQDWKTDPTRRNYAHKISYCQHTEVKQNDRVIFTCHKIDLKPQQFNAGIPNKSRFFKNIKNQYPNIFNNYMNNNPITRLWRKYNFDFVCFSAGSFRDRIDGGQTYIESNDRYPAELWSAILKTVRGGW